MYEYSARTCLKWLGMDTEKDNLELSLSEVDDSSSESDDDALPVATGKLCESKWKVTIAL